MVKILIVLEPEIVELHRRTVVGDYISTIKTTLDFNFDLF